MIDWRGEHNSRARQSSFVNRESTDLTIQRILTPFAERLAWKQRFARWCNGSTADSGSVCHGSNPCRAANFPQQNEVLAETDTIPAQNAAESESGNMRFPKTVRYRRAECKIYG